MALSPNTNDLVLTVLLYPCKNTATGLLLALTSSAHTPTLPISLDGSDPALSLLTVDALKRRFVEIERAGLVLGPREGKAASLSFAASAAAALGSAAAAALGAAFMASLDTVIISLGTSLGVNAGGEVIGKPGNCGVEDVKIDVVSIALVDIDGDVAPAKGCRSSTFSLLCSRDTGIVASKSADLRGDLITADNLLSEAGLEDGGGMLTLSRFTEVFVCSVFAWVPFLSASLGASSRWDEGIVQ